MAIETHKSLLNIPKNSHVHPQMRLAELPLSEPHPGVPGTLFVPWLRDQAQSSYSHETLPLDIVKGLIGEPQVMLVAINLISREGRELSAPLQEERHAAPVATLLWGFTHAPAFSELKVKGSRVFS